MIIIGCVGSRVGNRVRSICLFGCVHTPPRRRNYKKKTMGVKYLKVLVFAGGTSGYGGLVYG